MVKEGLQRHLQLTRRTAGGGALPVADDEQSHALLDRGLGGRLPQIRQVDDVLH